MSLFDDPHVKQMIREGKAESLSARRAFRLKQINDESEFWRGCYDRHEIAFQELSDRLFDLQLSLEDMTPEWWLKDNGFELGYTSFTGRECWHNPPEGLTVTSKMATINLRNHELCFHDTAEIDKIVFQLNLLKEAFKLAQEPQP